MPTFELQNAQGKTYQIEAPDQGAALNAFQNHVGSQSTPQQEPAPQADTDLLSKSRVVSGGLLEGNPIAGPLIRKGVDAAAAATIAGPMDWFTGGTSGA